LSHAKDRHSAGLGRPAVGLDRVHRGAPWPSPRTRRTSSGATGCRTRPVGRTVSAAATSSRPTGASTRTARDREERRNTFTCGQW